MKSELSISNWVSKLAKTKLATSIGLSFQNGWRKVTASFVSPKTLQRQPARKDLPSLIAKPSQVQSPLVAAVAKSLAKEITSFGPIMNAATHGRKLIYSALAQHHIGQIRAYDMHLRHTSDQEIGRILGIPTSTVRAWHEGVAKTLSKTVPGGGGVNHE